MEDNEDEVRNGTIWMLVHWLLPATASREDAIALISQAKKEYETGLTLSKRTDW